MEKDSNPEPDLVYKLSNPKKRYPKEVLSHLVLLAKKTNGLLK